MRYSELHIETRREMPAHARTDGERYLIRAGYLDSSRVPTAFGRLALARLDASVMADPRRWSMLGRVIKTADSATAIAAANGDRDVLLCPRCDYGDSLQTARARKVPPAAERLLPLERVATPDCHTIESLARFLGISQEKTAKALLYVRKGSDQLVLVMVRGDMQASEKKLQAVAGELQAATSEQITAAGAVPGYASPVGLRNVEVLVDDWIPASPNLVAGANQAGFHLLNSNYERDYQAQAIADLTLARPGDACPECGSPLNAARAYVVSDPAGLSGVHALLSLAEVFQDERGLRIPFGMGAFDVYLLHLPSREALTAPVADELHGRLEHAGISTLYDDRDERAGVKFNDADLIGCPVRITVGEKHLSDRMVELKPRSSSSIEITPIDAVLDRIQSLAKMAQQP
jgi:prolyl-tRNA synthetase